MATAAEPFEGRFRIYCHTVTFWWDIDANSLSPEDSAILTARAQDRAVEMIAQDCQAGELCAIHPTDDEDQVWGWWTIDHQFGELREVLS